MLQQQLGLEPKELPRSPAACGDGRPRGKQRQEGRAAQPSPGNTYSIVIDLLPIHDHTYCDHILPSECLSQS